jgi:lysozyme
MKPSEQAIHFLKKWEGCNLTAYKDVGGIWTVGYGCTGPQIKEGTVWSQEEADRELEARVATIGRILSKCIVPSLNQNQFDALVALSFNIGQGAFRGSTLLRLINTREYDKAPEQFLRWNHVGGQVVAGLTARRQAEAELFSKPVALS